MNILKIQNKKERKRERKMAFQEKRKNNNLLASWHFGGKYAIVSLLSLNSNQLSLVLLINNYSSNEINLKPPKKITFGR